MKKLYVLIIITLCILLSRPGSAQFNVYHPFPDSNAFWAETRYDGSTCGNGNILSWHYNFVLGGDTIVNGLTYHKVYQNGGVNYLDCDNGNIPYWYYSYGFYGAYREDTAKHIYACCTSDLGSKDTLLYDFTLKVGDTLRQYNAPSMYYPTPYTVNSIDSTLVGGVYRKRFNLKINGDSTIGRVPSIIEGIGSTQGLFEGMIDPFENFSTLNCFSQNGSTVWPYPVYSNCSLYYLDAPTIKQEDICIMVYPNPSNGKFTLEITNVKLPATSTIEVYNVLGEKVSSNPFTIYNSAFTIDLSNQPNGVYLYRVITESGELVGEGKIVIQK